MLFNMHLHTHMIMSLQVVLQHTQTSPTSQSSQTSLSSPTNHTSQCNQTSQSSQTNHASQCNQTSLSNQTSQSSQTNQSSQTRAPSQSNSRSSMLVRRKYQMERVSTCMYTYVRISSTMSMALSQCHSTIRTYSDTREVHVHVLSMCVILPPAHTCTSRDRVATYVPPRKQYGTIRHVPLFSIYTYMYVLYRENKSCSVSLHCKMGNISQFLSTVIANFPFKISCG